MAVLENNESMYSVSLDTVSATHHRIELRPGSKSRHQRPYRAGSQTRAFIDSHLQTQLDTEVIEPAHSE